MKTNVYNIPCVQGHEAEIQAAAQVIREGGLVAIPTETGYGLGADALNEQAVAAIYEDRVQPGEVVVIRYRGKHAAGMPEMLKATDAICNKPALCRSTALITDGRFSGASRGPCVGYLLPEAADGGPIGLVRDGDLIEIDVLRRSLELVGLEGQRRDPREIAAELSVRKRKTPVKIFRHQGALRYLSN